MAMSKLAVAAQIVWIHPAKMCASNILVFSTCKALQPIDVSAA